MADQIKTHEDGTVSIRRLIAFLGIVCVLVSQFLVFSKPVDDAEIFPPYTWLAVLGLFIFLASIFIRPSPFWDKVSDRFVLRDRTFWLAAAFTLSMVATYATINLAVFARINYIPVVTIWLFSALLYVKAFWVHKLEWDMVLGWVRQNRTELLTVLGITLFGAFFRFYRLGGIPRVIDGDEGFIGLVAQVTTSGELANPFALWANFGAMYLHLINTSIQLFGINSFALRLLPAIGGTLAIPSLYLLARWMGGRRIALLAALLVAFSHTHIHFSRIVSVAYIHGTWLAPLELYLLLSGLEKRESWRTALSGVLVAIHFSVYLTSQVIVGLVLVFMLLSAIFYRDWFKSRLAQAAAFWGGLITLILPSAYYIYTHPNEFFDRMVQNGTFQSGWLDQVVQTTGQGAAEILFGRFVHAFLALIYYPAYDFYGSPSPVMSMITSSLFLVGLVVALMRIRNPAYLLLNGYFWGATFAVGVFSIPASADSYRMLMALPAAFVMASVGLDQILEKLGLGWRTSRPEYVFSAAVVMVSLITFNMWTYYGDFAGKCRFGDNLAGRFASYLGSYAGGVKIEDQIYLLSTDIYYHGSHPSTNFLSDNRGIINVPEPIDTMTFVSGEIIIASPERVSELQTWVHSHPGGQLTNQYDCENLILSAYQVP